VLRTLNLFHQSLCLLAKSWRRSLFLLVFVVVVVIVGVSGKRDAEM
jgi:hypothetical protein